MINLKKQTTAQQSNSHKMPFMSATLGMSGPSMDHAGGSSSASKDQQSNLLEVYKWKLAFDGYRDRLPQYYNDYMNSYLKFLQMD